MSVSTASCFHTDDVMGAASLFTPFYLSKVAFFDFICGFCLVLNLPGCLVNFSRVKFLSTLCFLLGYFCCSFYAVLEFPELEFGVLNWDLSLRGNIELVFFNYIFNSQPSMVVRLCKHVWWCISSLTAFFVGDGW